MKNTSHVWRIFSLIFLAGAAAFAAQRLLRPDGFGEAGHFRMGSLFEVMEQEPVHQGNEICNECHDDICGKHDKDVHFDVKCEDCHGPGNIHVLYHMDEDESIAEEDASMPKEYTLEGCLFCHRKLAARPTTFPQVDRAEHYGFLDVNDSGTRCVECHSPHEPLFLMKEVSRARIHPVIYECDDCHDSKPEKEMSEVDGHPVVFTCTDCHNSVVKDFKTHSHSSLKCTTCHHFHRENDTAGRIMKTGNKRFCLLCHEKAGFKDGDRIPRIDSAEHMLENAEDLADLADYEGRDSAALAADPKVCLLCHFDDIHDSDLVEREEDKSDD
jgi:hypothetical protein